MNYIPTTDDDDDDDDDDPADLKRTASLFLRACVLRHVHPIGLPTEASRSPVLHRRTLAQSNEPSAAAAAAAPPHRRVAATTTAFFNAIHEFLLPLFPLARWCSEHRLHELAARPHSNVARRLRKMLFLFTDGSSWRARRTGGRSVGWPLGRSVARPGERRGLRETENEISRCLLLLLLLSGRCTLHSSRARPKIKT